MVFGFTTTILKFFISLISLFSSFKIFKIEILLAQNKATKVLTFLKKWILKNPSQTPVIHTLLLLKNKQNISIDSIIQVLEQISKQLKKPHFQLLAAMTELYLEKKSYSKVILHCEKLIKLTNNEELKSKIMFQIGFAYFSKNEYKKAETILEKAIKTKRAYSSSFNLLAYIYAMQNKNLEMAEKFSRVALHANPDCYYYSDTLGYILLRLKRPKESIYHLEKALKLCNKTIGNNIKTSEQNRQIKEITNHLKEAKSLINK